MCFCVTSKGKCHFPYAKGETPKLVVVFLRENTYFENESLKSSGSSFKKSYNNNGKPWKSLRILRVKPKTLEIFGDFSFVFCFFFFFFFAFCRFFCFVFSKKKSFSNVFFCFLLVFPFSFSFFHFLNMSIFSNVSNFSILLFPFFLCSIFNFVFPILSLLLFHLFLFFIVFSFFVSFF